MSETLSYSELRSGIYRSTSTNEVLRILDLIQNSDVNKDVATLSPDERQDLEISAFMTLQELTAESIYSAESIILGRLLPLCLQYDGSGNYHGYKFRDLLSRWLSQYPDEPQFELRERIIRELILALGSASPHSACWTISSVGYKTPEIVEALSAILQYDNETGDVALATLASLGVSTADKTRLLAETHRRMSARYNSSLLWAVMRLGNAESINLIYSLWLTEIPHIDKKVEPELAFTAVREILDANSNDLAIQDEVWVKVTRLVEANMSYLYRRFDIGHIPSRCNSSLVVPKLFQWMSEVGTSVNNQFWEIYLISLRLEECIMPQQLIGWSEITNSKSFDSLKQAVCQNTQSDLLTQTSEALSKLEAWKTLLRSGWKDALDWFELVVERESSRYVQAEIMELLSCFRVSPLPELAKNWIKESYDISIASKDGRELSRRTAAITLASSIATSESFDILLDFGLTHKDQPLTSTGDAIAQTALYLLNKGDKTVIDKLVALLISSELGYRRIAIAHVLEIIAASEGELVEPYANQILPTIYDEERDSIERGMLLNTLGYLLKWPIPEKFARDLEKWAHQPDTWIGAGSLFVLAKIGKLEQTPALLRQILSLEDESGFWTLKPDRNDFNWAPYIIGLLYSHNPEAFAPAIAAYIANSNWAAAIQVIRWLQTPNSKQRSSQLPDVVRHSLVRRIRDKQSNLYAETEVFTCLAIVAPDVLVEEQWENASENWLPDAREALAISIGEADVSDAALGNAILRLRSLIEDGIYAVRRAACRSLARHAMDTLYSICLSWTSDPRRKFRQRAAELWGWLELSSIRDGNKTIEQIYAALSTDPEPSVRLAAHTAYEERRRRLWAKTYLAKVTEISGEVNEEILGVWCYGDALIQIGDDSCIAALQRHSADKALPPNLRHWLGRVIKETQKKWRETTRKWPEPWQSLKGAIEQGHGKLILANHKIVDIDYSVWQHRASIPAEKNSWGGFFTSAEFLINEEGGIIELSNGRQGEILLSGMSNKLINFIGNGHYPD